jgi:hypothetical protein
VLVSLAASSLHAVKDNAAIAAVANKPINLIWSDFEPAENAEPCKATE